MSIEQRSSQGLPKKVIVFGRETFRRIAGSERRAREKQDDYDAISTSAIAILREGHERRSDSVGFDKLLSERDNMGFKGYKVNIWTRVQTETVLPEEPDVLFLNIALTAHDQKWDIGGTLERYDCALVRNTDGRYSTDPHLGAPSRRARKKIRQILNR